MQPSVEVAVPAAVAVARLMGSPEGLGSGGVAVGEARWHTKVACSSGDDIQAVVSRPSFWRKNPASEPFMKVSQSSNLHSDDVSKDHNLGNMSSHPPMLDIDFKLPMQKSGKIERKNGRCIKTSGMVQIGSSKKKAGSHDINGISPEVASSSASHNTSEKNQLTKQKNSSTGRRGDKHGDKRNCKVKHKNRCDSFSLKNGLVVFNSAAGVNNFFGMYGLKPDVFDITKHIDEPPLHDLLHGSYNSPSVASDKGKKATSSSNDLLQSVRNVCSVLQAHKVSQAQNCADVDGSSIPKGLTSLVTVSSAVGQTDDDKGDSYTAGLPSSNQVQGSDDKIKMASAAETPLYTPKEMMERLSLHPPKDLDLLLADATKTTLSSKSNTDPRLGKPVPNRAGLPHFPWSHSFSGHGKLGSEAVKLSTSRATCQGRWVRVENSFCLQKASADLLMDFESLTFDKSLVPSTNLTSEHQENTLAPTDQVFSTSVACSPSEVRADEYSPTYAAAQALLDMAAYSKESKDLSLPHIPGAVGRLIKRPSEMTLKASKSKAIKSSDSLVPQTKTTRPPNSLKDGDCGISSKKPRLSDAANGFTGHSEPVMKGKSQQSLPQLFKSPPRKLFRDSNANTDSYSSNLINKPRVMKTPRSADRSGCTKPKMWRSSQ